MTETNQQLVLVIAYGRSGSTLLMNILNSCEGCCIRGENGQSLYKVYESYRAIVENQNLKGRRSNLQTSPWWGIDDVHAENLGRRFVNTFIDEVLRPEENDRIIGFKEIRYQSKDVPDLREYLNFLALCKPGMKVVFNHRNISEVAKSKWWQHVPDASQRLSELDKKFYEFTSPREHFHFDYNRGIVDMDHIHDLIRFLGLDFNADNIEATLKIRHSY